ncbi:MAG: hypothetical protein KDJ52_00310 [Anaerolineae bacterium]|nr:hypothetical protein [Anaerolineae bacterium]
MPQTLSPVDLQNLLTTLPPGVKLEIEKTPSGEVRIMSAPQTKEQLLQAKYGDLIGQGISMSKAAKKYTIPRSAIEKWVYRNNYVDIIDEESYPKLIDEADVAVCAEIYHIRQKTSLSKGGAPYFDENGVVITEVQHPRLAAKRKREREGRD